MDRRSTGLSLVVLLIVLPVGPAGAQVDVGTTDSTTAAAERAIQAWLRSLDAGAWGTAWAQMAPGLQDTVSQERWETQGVRAREGLGPLHARQLVGARLRPALRTAPGTGPVVLLTYHSTFGTDFYVETILAVSGEETWRVAGYEIAPAAGRLR